MENKDVNKVAGRAQVLISRMRLGTDGQGIRTLLSFVGCPLNCKYCLNPELRTSNENIKWYTPEELFEDVRKDILYFNFTHGGFTFSGGEPLLHIAFIKEFIGLCRAFNNTFNYDFAIETSLNVPSIYVESLFDELGYVDLIIDLKDLNPSIYKAYTGVDNAKLLKNLKQLFKSGRMSQFHVFRLPLIPGFNTKDDVAASKKKLEKMARQEYRDVTIVYNEFEYIIDKKQLKGYDGHNACGLCKRCRQLAIEKFKLPIQQTECDFTGNCPGHCEVCDAELLRINKVTDVLGAAKWNELTGSGWAFKISEEDQKLCRNKLFQSVADVPAKYDAPDMLAGMPVPDDCMHRLLF